MNFACCSATTTRSLRQGLRKILEDRRDWRVVAEAGNGRDAVRRGASSSTPTSRCSTSGCRCSTGSKRRGRSSARAVRARPDPQHAQRPGVRHAGRPGRRSRVSPEGVSRRRVDRGDRGCRGRADHIFSPAVAQVVFDDYVRSLTERGITDRYDALSEREREVLQLVAEGESSKEIAEVLSDQSCHC